MQKDCYMNTVYIWWTTFKSDYCSDKYKCYKSISLIMGFIEREDIINMHNSMINRNSSNFDKMRNIERNIERNMMGKFQ